SLEIGTQIGDIARIVEAQTSLSEVYVEKSEFEVAERHLVEALQACEQTGSKSGDFHAPFFNISERT
ncbi:MAG: hypothetical protein ACP5JR_03745, partial [Thermoplasmata archaeon]